jgi:hypothetical protein
LLLDSRRTFGLREKGTCSAVLEQEVSAALNVSMPRTTRSRACAFDSKVKWCAEIIETEENGRHPDPGKSVSCARAHIEEAVGRSSSASPDDSLFTECYRPIYENTERSSPPWICLLTSLLLPSTRAAVNYRKSLSVDTAFPACLLDALAGYLFLTRDLGFEASVS